MESFYRQHDNKAREERSEGGVILSMIPFIANIAFSSMHRSCSFSCERQEKREKSRH